MVSVFRILQRGRKRSRHSVRKSNATKRHATGCDEAPPLDNIKATVRFPWQMRAFLVLLMANSLTIHDIIDFASTGKLCSDPKRAEFYANLPNVMATVVQGLLRQHNPSVLAQDPAIPEPSECSGDSSSIATTTPDTDCDGNTPRVPDINESRWLTYTWELVESLRQTGFKGPASKKLRKNLTESAKR